MRIMHQDLYLFPYKMQIVQPQNDANKAEGRALVQIISQRIEDLAYFLDHIFSVTRHIST